MKIKLLKSGEHSMNGGNGPAEDFEKDQETTVSNEDGFIMTHNGWAEEIFEEVDESEDDENEDNEDDEKSEAKKDEDFFQTLISGQYEVDQKQLLQDWGTTNLDIKVSKSKSVENMIIELVESQPETETETE